MPFHPLPGRSYLAHLKQYGGVARPTLENKALQPYWSANKNLPPGPEEISESSLALNVVAYRVFARPGWFPSGPFSESRFKRPDIQGIKSTPGGDFHFEGRLA